MTDAAGLRAMHTERAENSRAKSVATADAISALVWEEVPLTVAAVARRAGVSREFIYSHPELKEAIRRARADIAQRRLSISDAHTGDFALRAERTTLLARNEGLRAQLEAQNQELTKLRKQREQWLGNQLDSLANAVPQPELRAENERLNDRVIELHRDLESALRTIAGLEEDLRISRSAHAQSINELTRGIGGVTSLQMPKNGRA